MKKILAAAMLGCLALAMGNAPAGAQDKPMVEEVTERGVLRVGVKNDAPNQGFIDENGKYAGFEIELAADLAERLGVDVEYVPVKASNRVQLLEQGRIDMIFATLSHYRNRDRVIDFTISYLYTPQTMLVRKDSGIASVADMAGKRFGIDAGSGAVKKVPVAQPDATIQTFQSWPDAFFALQQGTVDAVATDNLILAGLRAAAPNPDDYVLLGKPGSYSGGYYGIGLRPNDSVSRDTLNFLLQDQWLDGTWQRAFDKWFGADSPLKLTRADFGDFEMRVWDD